MFKSPPLKHEASSLFTAKGRHVELLVGSSRGVHAPSRVPAQLRAEEGGAQFPKHRRKISLGGVTGLKPVSPYI